MKRLSAAITSWTDSLTGQLDEGGVSIDTTMDTTPSLTTVLFKLGGSPQVEVHPLVPTLNHTHIPPSL